MAWWVHHTTRRAMRAAPRTASASVGTTGTPLETIRIVGGILGFIVAIPVSYVCYRWTVGRFILPKVVEETRKAIAPKAEPV